MLYFVRCDFPRSLPACDVISKIQVESFWRCLVAQRKGSEGNMFKDNETEFIIGLIVEMRVVN